MNFALSVIELPVRPDILTDPTSVQGTGPIAGFELVMTRVWDGLGSSSRQEMI